MGMSRRAMLAALEDKRGTIEVDFTLEGDVDSPEFSLNEVLSAKLAYGIVETLGVSLRGWSRAWTPSAEGKPGR